MSTLHDRIRAVVEERLRIAREASGDTWVRGADRGYPCGTGDVYAIAPNGTPARIAQGTRCGPDVSAEQSSAHIAANDPADAILSAEHALSVLERHKPANGRAVPDPAGEYCDFCSHLTQIGHPYPCAETLALATRWRVEVDG